MALQLSITKYGTTFTEAYLRIETVYCSKDNGFAVYTATYTDAGSAVSNPGDPLEAKTHNFPWNTPISGADPVAQGYALLKSLDEYVGASDV